MAQLRPKVNTLFEGNAFSGAPGPAPPAHELFGERLAMQRNITTPFAPGATSAMPRASSSTASTNPYAQFDPRLSKRLSISLDDLYALGYGNAQMSLAA